ncbi:MAG: outer membrane protein assembly factor BamB family protein [Ruminiclostridium sp.]
MNNVSTTFLFDQFRTGRIKYTRGNKDYPEILWKCKLPSYPIRGAESTPVFDNDMNIYFGSHDGCFYSLNSRGRINWSFKTDKKIYSSPTLINNKIIVAGGDGYLYSFNNKDGKLLWVYDISNSFRSYKSLKVLLNRILTLHKTIDTSRKRIWTVRSWSSPNIDSEGILYITGYGTGVHAINSETGEKIWTFDLGSPRFHLSGVAINESNDIFVSSQQNQTFCLNSNGEVKWSFKFAKGYDSWGNPSIDPEEKTLYVPVSYRESKGKVYALDYKGNLKWAEDIPGALRGSVSISYEDYVIICSLNGSVYFLNKKSGDIKEQIHITDAIRGLWTTAAIDLNGDIFISIKDSFEEGSIICMNKYAHEIWRYRNLGKTLSVPVIDTGSRLYAGSWNGSFVCLQT